MVKQESGQEEEPRQAALAAGGPGVIPFFPDCRAVSPGATPHKHGANVNSRDEDDDEDEDEDEDNTSSDESCASNGTAGAVAEDGVGKKPKRAHASNDSEGEGETEESEGEDLDENDIILSTASNKKYKAVMIRHWDQLWGEQRKDGLKAAELSWKVLSELKGISGGNLYRGSKGENTVHPATDDEARESKFVIIWFDIYCHFSYFLLLTHLPKHFSLQRSELILAGGEQNGRARFSIRKIMMIQRGLRLKVMIF